jgi:hypothetical protein
MPSIILDVVSVIDAETSCAENSIDERQRFCFIVKETEKVSRMLKFLGCAVLCIRTSMNDHKSMNLASQTFWRPRGHST